MDESRGEGPRAGQCQGGLGGGVEERGGGLTSQYRGLVLIPWDGRVKERGVMTGQQRKLVAVQKNRERLLGGMNGGGERDEYD